ncbi:MAG TPA: hypothetical protein VI522_03020 [Gammaproteobacteria bacterium]|nr:hypothetical protein [Gammaproteobacteria bacterium]
MSHEQQCDMPTDINDLKLTGLSKKQLSQAEISNDTNAANLLKLAGLVIEMDDFHDTAIEDRDPKRNTDIIWNEMVALARGIQK